MSTRPCAPGVAVTDHTGLPAAGTGAQVSPPSSDRQRPFSPAAAISMSARPGTAIAAIERVERGKPTAGRAYQFRAESSVT